MACGVVSINDHADGGMAELHLMKLNVVWKASPVRRQCTPLVGAIEGENNNGIDDGEDRWILSRRDCMSRDVLGELCPCLQQL